MQNARFRCESAHYSPRLFTHGNQNYKPRKPKPVLFFFCFFFWFFLTMGRQPDCHRGVRCDEPFLCGRRFPRPLYCGRGGADRLLVLIFQPSPWPARIGAFNCKSVPWPFPCVSPSSPFVALPLLMCIIVHALGLPPWRWCSSRQLRLPAGDWPLSVLLGAHTS